MALAKVYDSEDTLMVPLDLEGTDSLSEYLYGAAVMVERGHHIGADKAADALRRLADAIDDARSAAGL